jgi:hypothetical protein
MLQSNEYAQLTLGFTHPAYNCFLQVKKDVILSISDTSQLGYQWLLVENIDSGNFSVFELLNNELSDIHLVGQSKAEAVTVYLSHCDSRIRS